MIKCFLSHSSRDKKTYVENVAKKLPKDWRVYDSDTFEHGMKTIDEIARGLDNSTLFVIFISNASLESSWVKQELTDAKVLLDSGKMKRIFPLIIDREVRYDDPRIPSWMKNDYNLRAVTRSGVAARRIQQRLRELSWELHPRLKERQLIFVGRNEQIAALEERFADVDRAPPICVICSGLPYIGRKTLIRNGFIKVGLRVDSYRPPTIVITAQDSVEDFIIKVFDLGFSDFERPDGLLEKTLDEKIKLAIVLCEDISKSDDILIIEDSGGIISYERAVVHWFDRLLQGLGPVGRTIFGVAARFRPDFKSHRNGRIFILQVPELTDLERMGLFKRLARFEGLQLSPSDYNHFRPVLYGFPDQVQYAITLIQEKGLPGAKHEIELLVAFNSDMAARFVEMYAPNSADLQFLYLLSEFEFISYDFLGALVELDNYKDTLGRFLAVAICEPIGASGEYLRLNDSIRDHMRRLRLDLPLDFEQKLRAQVSEFVKARDGDEIDASEYLYSVRSALASDTPVDKRLLVPSHFLNAMKDLYDRTRNYKQVISLADRVLQNESSLDSNIVREIRYFLCQSLARRRDARFLEEVMQVKAPEHQFLLGFYYRMIGRMEDAINQQRIAAKETRTASRARRELVQIYVGMENYLEALDLAKINYQDRPSNPFHIHAYLKCLIHSNRWQSHQDTIRQLFEALQRAGEVLPRAKEMWFSATALYLASCEADIEGALDAAEKAIDNFPSSPYPFFTKASILLRFGGDITEVSDLIGRAQALTARDQGFELPIRKLQAQLKFKQGNLADGLACAEPYLRLVASGQRASAVQRLQNYEVIGVPDSFSADGEL